MLSKAYFDPNEASVKISDQSITNSWCKVSRKKKEERRNRRTNPNTINPLWGRGFKNEAFGPAASNSDLNSNVLKRIPQVQVQQETSSRAVF